MEIELRWFKYSRGHTPQLQFRTMYRINEGAPTWSSWQKVPMVFENDGYSDT